MKNKLLYKQDPSLWSSSNASLMKKGRAPVIDQTFINNFPQYSNCMGDILKHHHIGGGGQAFAIPASLHKGFGGIHNIEKQFGIFGNDRLTKYA